MRWPWQTRQQTLSLYGLFGSDDGTFANADVTRTDQALRNAAVWACVRLIAGTISTLPVDALRGGAEVTAPLLASPAAGWTWSEWIYAVLVSLLLRGNAYGLIVGRTSSTSANQVELLSPDAVDCQIASDGSVVWRYRGQELNPNDLWRPRAYTFPGSILGLSPIQYARTTMALGVAMERFGNQFFTEGASPTGILAVQQPANQEMVNTLRERIKARTRGSREPLIVSGGATWTQLGLTNEDAQLIESQRWNVAQIARVFGVPPEMIGGDSGDQSTYANLEARSASFLMYGLTPWLVRLEETVSALLPRGTSIKFRTQGLLRATTKERYESYAIALANKFITVDEIRALEDMPSLPYVPGEPGEPGTP